MLVDLATHMVFTVCLPYAEVPGEVDKPTFSQLSFPYYLLYDFCCFHILIVFSIILCHFIIFYYILYLLYMSSLGGSLENSGEIPGILPGISPAYCCGYPRHIAGHTPGNMPGISLAYCQGYPRQYAGDLPGNMPGRSPAYNIIVSCYFLLNSTISYYFPVISYPARTPRGRNERLPPGLE